MLLSMVWSFDVVEKLMLKSDRRNHSPINGEPLSEANPHFIIVVLVQRLLKFKEIIN